MDYRDSIYTLLAHIAMEAARDFYLNENQTEVYRRMLKYRLKLCGDYFTPAVYDRIIETIDGRKDT